MCHTAGHFAPCRCLLRAQQIAGVFNDDDESPNCAARAAGRSDNRGYSDGQMYGGHRRADLKLTRGLPGAQSAIHQITDFSGVFAGKQLIETTRILQLSGRENGFERFVDALNQARGIVSNT